MARFAPVASIPRIELGEEVVLFNPVSWETHVLNPAAAAVFELLTESPRDVDEVARYLSEMLQETEQPRAREHAEVVLRDLAALALIREADDAGGATV